MKREQIQASHNGKLWEHALRWMVGTLSFSRGEGHVGFYTGRGVGAQPCVVLLASVLPLAALLAMKLIAKVSEFPLGELNLHTTEGVPTRTPHGVSSTSPATFNAHVRYS